MSSHICAVLVILFSVFSKIATFCGESVRWSQQFDIENTYGMWFGVAHFQHTPEVTNMPNKIGCVSLYIYDVTNEIRQDWLGVNSFAPRRNWSYAEWRSTHSNPWSDTAMSGSWMDVRFKRKVKRDLSSLGDRRLQILWNEDGQTEEQRYLYRAAFPGLWTLEQWRPMEREMLSRGLELYLPNAPSKRAESIRILQSTPDSLVLFHCIEGRGGAFSLVLRRSPTPLGRWGWLEMQQLLAGYDMPPANRRSAVCAAAEGLASAIIVTGLVGFLMLVC